jgi:hypothetical protein
MKRILPIAVMAFFLYACQITERIYLSETGSVKYESEIDFSDMMSFMYTPEKIDSMKLIGEFPIDTIVPMADADQFQKPDADEPSQAEKNFIKSLDKTSMRLVMNENEGRIVIVTEEKDVKSFNAYFENVDKSLKQYAKEDKEGSSQFSEAGYMNILNLNYDGKSFERKSFSKVVDFSDSQTDSAAFSSKDMMNMFGYRMEYHFPKKVKSVDLEGAMIGADGKTIIADVEYVDILENPEKYNFKVKFE